MNIVIEVGMVKDLKKKKDWINKSHEMVVYVSTSLKSKEYKRMVQ